MYRSIFLSVSLNDSRYRSLIMLSNKQLNLKCYHFHIQHVRFWFSCFQNMTSKTQQMLHYFLSVSLSNYYSRYCNRSNTIKYPIPAVKRIIFTFEIFLRHDISKWENSERVASCKSMKLSNAIWHMYVTAIHWEIWRH